MSWPPTGWSWWPSHARFTGRLRLLRQVNGPSEAALLVRILAVAAMAPLLARLPLTRLEAVLEPQPLRSPSLQPGAERIVELVDLASRVGYPVIRRGCLTRGITSYWFLRRGGHQVSLVFGLDAAHGSPVGHCWLQTDDEPRFEKTDPRAAFPVVASIPAHD